MSRTLQVEGDKVFRITIPEDTKITFGPWSPPGAGKSELSYGQSGRARGTLRIYQGSKENIIGCFSDVLSFREISAIDYTEQVAKEEGAVIWKSDKDGYQREEKIKNATEWVEEPKALPARASRKKK